MASIETPKRDLVAICKLEFYKKQKNWKFCSQERKAKESKRRTKSINTKLNQTYNVAPAPESPKEKEEYSEPEIPEAEDPQILNEAFVETETGIGSESDEHVCQDVLKKYFDEGTDIPSSHSDPPGSPYSPRWSIQRWAEQHHLWNPEPSPTKQIEPISDPIYPEHDPNCPHSPVTDLQSCHTYINQDTNVFFDNNFNKIQQDIYSNQNPYNIDAYSNNELNYTNQHYNPKFASEIYYNSNMCHYGDDPNVGSVGMMCEGAVGDWGAGEAAWSAAECAEAAGGEAAGDAVDGGRRPDLVGQPGYPRRPAGTAPKRRKETSVSECESLPSVSSGEFIRGAALAPHSTQVDLLIASEHSGLSGAALAAAVEGHSAALIELLQETQRRHQIPQTEIPLPSIHSYDEIPVQDSGPYHVPQFNDPILASYKTKPDLWGQTGQGEEGRGRGRLKVGIRMGRPYRLSH